MEQNILKIENKQSRWKYLITVFVLLFITFALTIIVFRHMQKPDPVSEAFFRQKAAKILGKDPNELTEEDFAKITTQAFRFHAIQTIPRENQNQSQTC